MRLTGSLVLTLLVLALPASASAQAPPVQSFEYVGHSGVHEGGYYVGPYNGSLGGVAYDIFCVDARTAVYTGGKYDVYATPLTNTDALTLPGPLYSRLDNSEDVYAQAAWLAMQFQPGVNEADWGDIHQAIWNITGGPDLTGADNAAYWEAEALANYSSVNLSEWSVLTPVEQTSQEFLVHNVVPEPETWAMLVFGLLAVGGVALRRRERPEAA